MGTLRNPPEYKISELSKPEFVQAIDTYGCVLIREAIPQTILSMYLERAKKAYAYRDEQFKRGEMPEGFINSMYRFGHVAGTELDEEGERFSVIQKTVLSTPLIHYLVAYYNNDVGFIANNCLPRRQHPKEIKNPSVPYHQDAAFIGDTFFVLNCWTPLVPCGKDAPSLEVVLDGSIRSLIKPPYLGEADKTPYEQISHEPQWVQEQYGDEKCWHPEMEPGDVLVFSNFTLHRTYQTPMMTEERISVELRCSALTEELSNSRFSILPIQHKHNKSAVA